MPSDSQAGPTTDLFGQPLSPANPLVRLRSQTEARRVKETTGIYSPFGRHSSASFDLQQSLESRLRAQFSGDGSTKHSGRWKKTVTPAGRPLCQLSLAARRVGAVFDPEFIGKEHASNIAFSDKKATP